MFHVKKLQKNFVSRETFFIFAATSAKGQSKARNQ